MGLQIEATATRTDIIRIKRMFILLVTVWLKNWMVIHWLGKLDVNILLKCAHFRGRKSVVWRTMLNQFYEI